MKIKLGPKTKEKFLMFLLELGEADIFFVAYDQGTRWIVAEEVMEIYEKWKKGCPPGDSV